MAEQSYVLPGHSKRSVERRVFARNLRVSLTKGTDSTSAKIARAYAKAWAQMNRISAEMAQHAAEAIHAGGLSPREVARLDRVDRAQLALERQVRQLNRFTGVTVRGGSASGAAKTLSDVLDGLGSLTGVDRHFTKPSGAAMEGLILRSTERIESATRALDARASVALKEGLFRGLVLGENPKVTAKHVFTETKDAFFGGLARANTIARTELADSHRYASRLAYNDSDLVVGWKWLSVLSARTCPACWAMHNTFHEKSEMQFGHQNCRCTMVPVLADDLPSDNDLGDPEAIFWGLPREEQLSIMGPGRLKALEGGARFTDLTYLKNNAGWRPSQQTTSVADLTGIAELNIATTPGDVITIPGETNESILTHAFKQGGLTINALTGEQPTSGFVVARNGTSSVIDAREFFGPAGPNAVAQFLTTHGDLLDEAGTQMGMWYDTKNGKVVLDVVQIVPDRDAAVALGKANDQISIFDLDTFTEIPTGGTGGYADPGEELAVGWGDVGRTVTATAGPREISGRVVSVDPDGKVTIKSTDGGLYTVKPENVHSYLDKPIDPEAVKRVESMAHALANDTGIDVKFTGADERTAIEMAATARRLSAEFPDTKPASVKLDDIGGTAYAITHTRFHGDDDGSRMVQVPDSRISMARQYAGNFDTFKAQAEKDQTSGFHPKNSADKPVEFTLTHEWGHVVDNYLWPDGEDQSSRKEMLNHVWSALDQAPDSILRFKALEKDLSQYAGKDDAELIAEAFAGYLSNGPGASIVADTVMRDIVRRYEQRYGHRPQIRDLDRLMKEST